jgi:hypothetical protein
MEELKPGAAQSLNGTSVVIFLDAFLAIGFKVCAVRKQQKPYTAAA